MCAFIDTIPSQVTLVSAAASNGGVCNAGVLCVLGSLAVSEVVSVTLVVDVDPALRAGSIVNNKATVFSERT